MTKNVNRAGRATKTLTAVVGLGLLGAGLTGCVSTERYNNVNDANKRLTVRNQELVAEVEQLQAANTQLSSSGSARADIVSQLQASNTDLTNRLSRAQDTLRRFNERLGELSYGALDAETDAALVQLAASNAELLSYDAERGMIRFSSDLTFPSGSDQVRPEAQQALRELAAVLTTSTGGQYEMHIVGHTDNQAISSRTRARHATNMHLAAHRAISVRATLRGMGVPPSRMSVGGWGEHRPLVENNARGGTAQNRRVEIFLRPVSGEAQDVVTQPTTEPAGTSSRAPSVGEEPTK